MATMREIREHVFGVATWVDPEHTADRIMFGDPDRPVTRIGTGWTPCAFNLEAASAEGCELFISHEVPFYGNWAPGLDSTETAWGKRRMAVLERTGMCCMNLHDTWDNFPEYGIRDSWRRFLQLGDVIEERPYYYPGGNRFTPRPSLVLCRVRPQTLLEFCRFVAVRTGQFVSSHGATFVGDAHAVLTTVATGVGCHIPTAEMLALGADALVVTLDRALQTTVRIPLAEMGANLVVVEHGTAEMPGMQNLAEYLNAAFPGVEATFYCREPAATTMV